MTPAFSKRLLHLLDGFSEALGRAVAWLTLAMALATLAVVIARYVLGINSVALQESVIYMHSAVFLLAAGFTLKRGGHVRVDIFYRRFHPRTRAWVDCVGTLVLLLPLCAFLLLISWEFVAGAWRDLETSPEPGGLPAVFLLKSLIPAAAVTLALQGLAEVLRGLLVLTDGEETC